MALLRAVPRAEWEQLTWRGQTLLHIAAAGIDLPAVVALIAAKFDLNAFDVLHETPVHYAARHGDVRVLELLCASGANVNVRCNHGYSPLRRAIMCANEVHARVLVANGVRMSGTREFFENSKRASRRHDWPLLCTNLVRRLEAFERGVLKCRRAVVTMLRVKRKVNLSRWDKFLLREVAYAIWATRYDKQWQK